LWIAVLSGGSDSPSYGAAAVYGLPDRACREGTPELAHFLRELWRLELQPLNQITRENVKAAGTGLGILRGAPPGEHHHSQWARSRAPGGGRRALPRGMQNNVYAMEAATGRALWTYTYTWGDKPITGIKGARGLALGDGRVYMGTQDNHLVSLDAKREGNLERRSADFSECLCKITAAPLLVKDKLITASPAAASSTCAVTWMLDAKTGQRLWHFDVIPSPGQPGSETWTDESWKTGGGATWFTGTYDPELNLIYWGTGDPAPAYKPDVRPGLNLYATSLLALDADTGQLKWYFQETPHDLYDYDSQAEPVIVDLTLDGRKRKVIVHPSKNGFVYLYDRATGDLLRTFPYSWQNWTKGLDAHGVPTETVIPEDQKNFLICPSISNGARGISHSAYSPRTGWWYTTDLEMCTFLVDGADNRKTR